MSALTKSLVLCSVLCFTMVTSLAFAVKIDLPKDAIVLEADAGKMDKGVKIIDEKDASEGKATDHERGIKTEHEIDIPKAGDWYLWIRIFCPDGGRDSYWIGIDKATPDPAEDALGEQAVRIYSAAGDSVNTKDQPFNIWFWDFGKSNADPHSSFKIKSPGKHILWSKGREPGTLLDQLLLTMDDTFNPEEETKGEWIQIPAAVEPEAKLAATWGRIKAR
ncbi:hypothetical protein IH992_21675 [Candidatus Poribacteria bacterium]|nr:hypothetical protein [Candidatus Poribacteria bacterium]